MAKAKDVHIDLLEVDMEAGSHWLDPVQVNRGKLNAIREQKRKEWLARKGEPAAKAKK